MRLVVKSKPVYIGPRGGKWADPEHTEHWKPGEEKSTLSQQLQQKLKKLGKGKGRHVALTKEELKAVLDSGKFALVSAGKSPHDKKGFTKYDADKRHKLLRHMLISKGYAFTQGIGNYDGVEDSFLVMVHDIDRPDIIDIGKRLNQDSVVYAEAGEYWMHYTTGDNAVKNLARYTKDWHWTPEATNYYTIIKHPDGTESKFNIRFFDEGHGQEVVYDQRKLVKAILAVGSDIRKSVPHEKFVTTVMTMPGDVKKIGKGRFGARQVNFGNGVKATLKPKLFSTEKFRGISRDTQHLREAAAYQLDWKVLHFNVIPPTVLTMYHGMQSSIQAWVPGVPARAIVPDVFRTSIDDWRERVAKFAALINIEQLRKVVLFDLIVNNTDRHCGNCLFDRFGNKVWAIDNGLTFGHHYQRYYNVFHKYLFPRNFTLKKEERELLENLQPEMVQSLLKRFLRPQEIAETLARVRWMLEQKDLGFEVVAPEGGRGRNDFPSMAAWFKKQRQSTNRVIEAIDEMGHEEL